MLRPRYRGALAADVSTRRTDTDPVYPESRTAPPVAGVVAPRGRHPHLNVAERRGGGRGGASGTTAPGSGGVGGISPDLTWDSGYTKAPNETAHGDYMKLMASAGLAFDRVHLAYLAETNLRIHRTEREQSGKVAWRIERLRPNLPKGESEPQRQQ